MKILRVAAGLLLSISIVPIFTGTVLASCLTQFEVPQGGFEWPAAGEISKAWSLSCASDRGHRGMDIDLPSGTDIAAMASGIVTFTGYTPAEGGGLTVSVEHDGGLKSTYIHLDEIYLSRGEKIAQGQIIGLSDGRPLHLGIKSASGSRYVDPESVLPELPPSSIQKEESAVVAAGTSLASPITVEPETVAVAEPVPAQQSTIPVNIRAIESFSANEVTVPARQNLVTPAETANLIIADSSATIPANSETANVGSGIQHSATGVVDTGQALREIYRGMGLRYEPIATRGTLIGYDGPLVPEWSGWIGSHVRRSAALGLLLATMVLAAIRRLVWSSPERREIYSRSSQRDQFPGPGPLHRAAGQ